MELKKRNLISYLFHSLNIIGDGSKPNISITVKFESETLLSPRILETLEMLLLPKSINSVRNSNLNKCPFKKSNYLLNVITRNLNAVII